ncbi:MAG: hypothetical protein IKP91_04190 [Bacteroidaceae bacterium]|jgi:hypothetical protein|nr:hypothetical protein [Bacteroidaceae bacterium]
MKKCVPSSGKTRNHNFCNLIISLGHTRLINELFTKGKVVDNRYLFF